jgi:anaerobic ribonucleoside-triphosphate reductase
MIRDFSAKEVKNDERFESLQTNIENAKFSINLRIDSLIEENFKIPDILQDDSFKPTSFRDFMTSNLVSLQNQITRLDSHLEKDFLPKITF